MSTQEEEIELIDTLYNRCLMKLRQNRHKKHWLSMSLNDAFNRACEELEELKEAIIENKPVYEVYNECADVANFIAFIMDIYRKEKV
jgi:hypothetical protein